MFCSMQILNENRPPKNGTLRLFSLGKVKYVIFFGEHEGPSVFSCASAKAERRLSSLYGMCLCVELGDPPPPTRISWVCTKMLHHFCMTADLT